MKAPTSSNDSDKPRVFVRNRRGRMWLVSHVPLEVEQSQAMQRGLSKGVVAALVGDFLELTKPKKP